ncbi:fasciclin-like arabinogalactan protein 11 [Arachis duranensis]|uniref:Fasciclin-like arabinogalactan protein 11 n=1 Tax=Arachis duranensis TaxID=130453 RepID=A0A6P4CY02_ARADU|nr:fasciclin-like arabinogalactan protein 11 [Arachis duranensis]
MMRRMQLQSLLFSSSLILITLSTVTSAQLSPVQPPTTTTTTAPPTPPLSQPTAPAPGFNTVPLVPTTPSAAPTPTVTVPKGPTIDIVQILKKAKRFSVLIRLLKTTQLINQLNSQLVTTSSGGLTLFAPEDSAFSKLKPGFLNSLTDRQKVELLQFHSLSSFIAISNFDTLTNPVQTQAGDDPQRLQLNVTTYGGSQVNMATGAVNATITGTIYSDNKLAIYQVDKVLLPLDLVLPAKSPAPAPGLASAKALPKAAKGNSTTAADDSGSDAGDTDDDKALPTDASSAESVKVVVWMNVAVAVALVGATML